MDYDQEKDVGVIFSLLLILLAWRTSYNYFFYCAVASLLLTLFYPKSLTSLKKLWFFIGDVLNFVNTRVILTIVYFLVLFPTSFVIRIFNKNYLDVRNWNNDLSSLFKIRDHLFIKEDLADPF